MKTCQRTTFDATDTGTTGCVGAFYISAFWVDAEDTTFGTQILERDPEMSCGILVEPGNQVYAGMAVVGDKWKMAASWFLADHDPTEDTSIEVISIESGIVTIEICTGKDDCSDHKTEAECNAAGCYWYDGSCHSKSPPPTDPEEDPDAEDWNCITSQVNIGSDISRRRQADDGKEYRIDAELTQVSSAGSNKAKIDVSFKKDWDRSSTWVALAPGDYRTFTDPGGVDWIVHVSQTEAAGIWSSARMSVCYAQPAPPPAVPSITIALDRTKIAPRDTVHITGTWDFDGMENRGEVTCCQITPESETIYQNTSPDDIGTFEVEWIAPDDISTDIEFMAALYNTLDEIVAAATILLSCYATWWNPLITAIRTANEGITSPITDLFPTTDIEGWTTPPFTCPICEQVFEGEGSETDYATHLMSHIKAFEQGWFGQ